MTWLDAFLVTEAVEAPVVVAVWTALHRWTRSHGAMATAPPSLWFRVAGGVVPSAVTHPFLWHLALFLLHDAALCGRPSAMPCYVAVVLPLEAVVVAVEGLLLRWLDVPRPFTTSLVANTASVAAGLLMR